MGQAASKLGTGLKSTGGSFRREGVQAYPVLVYTNFLTGPPRFEHDYETYQTTIAHTNCLQQKNALPGV